jgi:hypothetical protein
MKPSPHGSMSPRNLEHRRDEARESDEVVSAAASRSATSEGPVEQAQGAFGNGVLRSALDGASVGGLGPVLRSAVMRSISGVQDQPPSNFDLIRALSGGGVPLAGAVRSQMETAFGHDFGDVRIHTGTDAARASAALSASAFAVGSHVFFGEGQYQPGSGQGMQLLAHELTHVVQSHEGRIVGHGVSSPSDATEREAYRNEKIWRDAEGMYSDSGGKRSAPTSPSLSARFARSADPNATAPAQPQVPAESGPLTSPDVLPSAPMTSVPSGNTSAPGVSPTSTRNFEGSGAPSFTPTSTGGGMSLGGGPALSTGSGGGVSVGAGSGGFSERIRAAAEAQRTALTTKAASVKEALGTAIEAQRQRLVDGFDQLLTRLQTARDNAIRDVETRSEAAKTRVRDAASTERGKLDEALRTQQANARRVGEEIAGEAIRAAAAEGERAAQGCVSRAARARTVANGWASKFGSLEGGGDVASSVRSEGEKLASTIEGGMGEARRLCAEHGEKIATDIRKDASDVAGGMEEKIRESRERIDKDRDDAITAIDEGVTSARTGINQSFDQTRQQIEQKKTEAVAQFDQLKGGATAQVDTALTEMLGKLDEVVGQMTSDVDGLVAAAAEVAFAPEVEAEANAGIERTVAEHEAKLAEFGTQAVAGFDGVLTDAQTAASGQIDGILSQIEGAASGYEADLANKVSQCVAKADESADSAVRDMQSVTPLANAELQKGVDKSRGEWRNQLGEKMGVLRGRVDQILSQHDQKIGELDSQMSSKYNEARNKIAEAQRDKPWYEDAWDTVSDWAKTAFDFVAGFVVGFFTAAWELLKGLWKLLSSPLGWLLLAIAIILVVIIVVLFGWTALIIAGIILGIIMAAYYIYLAVTTPGLSAYERGKLFGKGAFELVLGFAGVQWKGGQLLRFTEWGGLLPRAVKVVQQAGSVGKAAELYRMVGSLDRVISLIDKVGDAGKVVEMVQKVGSAEKLVGLLDKFGDINKLTSMIDRVGSAEKLASLMDKVGDAERLGTLLDKVGDVGQLTAMLDKVGDAGKLSTLLDKVGDVGQLSTLLDKVGDVGQLSTLLDKVGDVGQLSTLLDRVGDAGKLSTLLDKVGDVSQLSTLIDRVGDVDKLATLLDKVSDVGQLSALLDKVGDAGKLAELLDKVGDASKLSTMLDKVGDAGKLGELIDRIGDVDKLAALLDKVGDPGKLGTLLDKVGDPGKLGELIDKAGSADQLAALLDRVSDPGQLAALLDKAGSGEKLAKLLDQVGDAGKLDTLLNKAGDVGTLERFLAKASADDVARILEATDDPKLALKMLEDGATPQQVLDRLAQVKADAARVAELEANGGLDANKFHGSNSDMLDGLKNTDGEVLSAKDLEARGITPKTGEGDAFSGRAGPKDFVSVGEGGPGMGTSLAYADDAFRMTQYNPQVYKIDELKAAIDQLEGVIANYDNIAAHLPQGIGKSKEQFVNRLKELQAEWNLRQALPKDSPRYLGGQGNQSNFPILFEFDAAGLASRSRGLPPGQMLGGEGWIYQAIDLKTRLVRVYVPEANRAETIARLEEILGHGNFEVISLEGALQGLRSGGGVAATKDATAQGLSELQKYFEALQKAYLEAAKNGGDVDLARFLEEYGKLP